MKFICNNCGFSAEVPDRRTTCPMCASDNVSVATMTEQLTKEPVKNEEPQNIKNESDDQPVSENSDSVKKKRGPTERITLNDEFFSSKPNKEDHEIASILQELYPESGGKEKSSFKLPDKKMLVIAAVVAVVIIVSAVLAVTFTGDRSEKSPEALVKADAIEENESQIVPEEEEEELIEEADVKPIHSPAVVKKEQEEIVAEPDEQTVKQEEVKTESKKIEEVVKKQPKKQKIVSEAPVKKAKEAKPAINVKETFDNYVQAGHKALSAQKYTDALHEYKNASRLIPSNGPVYKFLGITYAYLKNQQQACANYTKYIQLSPNAPDKAQVEAFLKACQ